MHNFYPGPSKLYPEVKTWLSEIFDSGILSKNHRSDAFMQLWKETESNLKASLSIPNDYEIYVTSSATECWEIVNQSLLAGKVDYIFNGAFGEKWFDYGLKSAEYLTSKSRTINGLTFGLNGYVTDVFSEKSNTVCLTHNETSNGTYLPDDTLQQIRKANPEALIAVDATSSMAGISLPWESGDVWFASVQKCFGLPSGIALMVVSPRAIGRAEEVNEQSHYNSFLNIRANFLKNQTPYTPNILGIALLNKQAAFVENIKIVDERTRSRAKQFYQFIEQETSFSLLVENESVRSPAVIAIKGESAEIKQVIADLKQKGITLGKGYGEWKETTFRIANFPAIGDEEFEVLKNALRQFPFRG